LIPNLIEVNKMPEEKKSNNDKIENYDNGMGSSLEKVEVDLRFMKPGSMLVGTSFDKRGNKIKGPNETFTKSDIQKLIDKGITKLYYIPEVPKSSLADTLPKLHDDFIDQQSDEGVDQSFLSQQHSLRDIIRKNYEKIKKSKLNKLLEELTTKKKFMIKLLVPQKKDKSFASEGLFTHSVNVATLSLITAHHLRLKPEAILDVALSSLLHDIGIVKIDPAIIEKENELTKEEFIEVQKHPLYTVNILKDIKGIDKKILLMCVQHHEHLDGSGYPKKLKGKDIFPLSQIISVSEMYDALVSRKPYCKSISTSQALLYFYMKSGKFYHRKIANTFIKAIWERMRIPNIFPEGCRVVLNTNEIAVVSAITDNTIRPQIDIVKDSKQAPLKHPIQVDLRKDVNREIIRVLKLATGEETIPEANVIFRHFY
jgi:HD-GYP domain-containing protein (c-di-GMP phosphodiesterase class II)